VVEGIVFRRFQLAEVFTKTHHLPIRIGPDEIRIKFHTNNAILLRSVLVSNNSDEGNILFNLLYLLFNVAPVAVEIVCYWS